MHYEALIFALLSSLLTKRQWLALRYFFIKDANLFRTLKNVILKILTVMSSVLKSFKLRQILVISAFNDFGRQWSKLVCKIAITNLWKSERPVLYKHVTHVTHVTLLGQLV